VQESCSNRAKLVRVKLAGLQAEGAMFQAAFAAAVGHRLRNNPPKYLTKPLFSFRGVTRSRSPRRLHPCRSVNQSRVA
jgi:hypothetical protein